MIEPYDVVVVGGGIAGLTATAYLARAGVNVLLCERSEKTGGLVKSFNVRGYTFDAGLRAFENSGILFPMLRDLGINPVFLPNELSISVGDESVILKDKSSLTEYGRMLIKLFPANEKEIHAITKEIAKVMGYMDVIYGIDNPLFIDFMNDRDYLFKTLLPWLLKYQINIRKAKRMKKPVREHLAAFTSNEALTDIIVQHFFTDTQAFFALSYFSLYLDYIYSKGGTSALTTALSDFSLERGAGILTSADVVAIDANTRMIQLADGRTLAYKKLIWAADQSRLYEQLISPLPQKAIRYRDILRNSEGGDSVLTLYIGANLDRDYFLKRATAHFFYTPRLCGLSSLPTVGEALKLDQKERFCWLEQYLDLTTYEVSVPALRDADLAPEGSCGLIISTLMDYRFVAQIREEGAYERFKRICSDKIIALLDERKFPGLADHIEFSFCSTPLTIERESGNKQGAITGWAFTNDSMPSVHDFTKIKDSILTELEHVYQCGMWTFSPSGMPVSILTGKLAADAALASLETEKR